MKKIVSFVLAAILLTGMLFVYVPGNVWAGQTRENVTVYVNGEKHIVRGLNHEYENNLYLSLKDLANAVNNTSKAFELQWKEIDGDTVAVLSKVEAGMADTEEKVF